MNLRTLALAVAIALPAAAQTPYLVTDLNTTSGEGAMSSNPESFTAIGDTLYFSATTSGSGRELWKFVGGVATMVAEIAPGSASSTPRDFMDFGGGTVLFRANDAAHGTELWRTDGTAAGTSMVKDIHPTGNTFTSFAHAMFGGKLYFVANDGVHGLEPWVTDGTTAGTEILLDLDGVATSSSTNIITVLGDKLLIFGADGLWTSDGTTLGTTRLTTVGSAWGLGRIGATVFFTATGPGGTGRELWKSDGTAAGTQLVMDIIPGTTSGLTTEAGLVSIGSTLYISAQHPGGGVELWKSDGTTAGTQFVKLLTTDPTVSAFNMTAIGDKLLFQVDYELWRSDGTAAGTFVLDDGSAPDDWPLGPFSGAYNLVGAFGRGYYFRPGPEGGELWSTDGSTATFVAPAYYGMQLTSTGGKLYFRKPETLFGTEPWVSEAGTAATTHRLANVQPDLAPSSFPNTLTAAGNLVFFRAYDGFSKNDIWRSDGTAGGTFRLTSRSNAPNSEAPVSLLTAWNGALYFKYLDMELWRSNGTVAGTTLVKNFAPPGTFPFSRMFAGSQYLFLNGSRFSFGELWRSDGTTAGTITLGELLPNYQYPNSPAGFAELAGRVYVAGGEPFRAGMWVTQGTPATTKMLFNTASYNAVQNVVAAAGAIFYVGTDPTSGSELWRSDGTAGSQVLVKEIAPGDVSSSPTSLTPAGRLLYFVANDGTTGNELWRTDGTSAGTILLADIAAGSASSAPANLTAFGDLLYFTANNGTHGVELWRSDGTPGGTAMVVDLRAGSASADPTSLLVAGGSLWFSANDGVNGTELWRLTLPATLTMVADLEPGSASSNPYDLVSAGQKLFFTATTSLGRELWALSFTQPTLRVDDARVVEGTGGTRTMRFTVTRDGSTAAAASATFTTSNGTAASGADYVASTGSVAFTAGQTTQFVDVLVQADAVSEPNEAFFLALSAPSGAGLGRSVATGIIEDDDHRADLSIVAVDPDPSETFVWNDERNFLITNSGPSTATDLRVRFSESPGNMPLELAFKCKSEHDNPITCNFESLAAGATLAVRVYATPNARGTINGEVSPGDTITASVSAAEPDDVPANNTVSRIQSQDGHIIAPAFLTSGSTATVRVAQLILQPWETLTTLTSNVPGVVVSPSSIVVPPNQRYATFTVTTGAYTGPVKLTATPASYEGTAMTLYVVAPGATPKLDTAIDATGSSVTYGEDGTVTVNIAARKHDGTLPTGVVTLLDASWNVIAQQTLDATATTVFTRTGLLPGHNGYFVRYEGDAKFNAMQYAQTGISVSGWKTELQMDVPPLICAGTAQQIFVTLRSSETTNAPAGTVEVTVGSTVVANLPLSPTGVPGESRAILQRSFVEGDFSISARYLPSGTFQESSKGVHFQTVSCVPLNVSATGTSVNSVSVSWTAIAGAHHYDVVRSANRTNWYTIATTAGTAVVDGDHSWTRAYLYTVRALDAANNTIGWGAPDLAMNMVFTDPVIGAATPIRATHVEELRVAANALQWFGTTADVTIVPPVPVGSAIKAADINTLRNDITALRRGLGLPLITFSSANVVVGARIKAIEIQELRNAVK